jgi:MFS family permease
MSLNPIATSEGSRAQMRPFLIAWMFCTVFYFLEYAIRSAPAVMIPELAQLFGVSTVGVSTIVGAYYYTYAATSLVAGVLLDHYGAKYVIPAGTFILACGCVAFALPHPLAGDIGRLLQGAGSAFAFTGAVYLASHGLPAQRLATAIGVTQCLGMLGGSVGQIAVGPLVKGMMTVPAFWHVSGLLVFAVALLLVWITPKEQRIEAAVSSAPGILKPYKIVFSNPQSYLCGVVSGLLFAPTTIFDFVWGVRYLQEDIDFPYRSAVFAVSMVPFGWVIGCPLLGWLADHWRRRKPALALGTLIMLICVLQLAFLPMLAPTWVTLLTFGIGSGAAMIPYSIIKEANPDCVKGSATGAMNCLTFSVTAVLGPIFASYFGKSLGTTLDHAMHLHHTHLFWIAIIGLALILTLFLEETGTPRPPQPSALQRRRLQENRGDLRSAPSAYTRLRTPVRSRTPTEAMIKRG